MTLNSDPISATTLRVLSVANFSVAAVSRPPVLAATAAAVGLVLFVWSLVADDSAVDRVPFRWAGLAVIAILLLRSTGIVGRLTESEAAAGPTWFVPLIVAAALAIFWGRRPAPRLVSIVVAFLAVLISTLAMTVGEWRSDLGLDVYWMHREAGEALFAGENPYTDAVTVNNGSPLAPEGAVIEGYPYPPVVVGSYAVAGAEADPRLVSSVAWLAVLGWMGWRARRAGRHGDTAYAMFILLAGLAVWPVVWFASWTEPLSVALFLLSALLWRRRPALSAVALGVALASKQYFLFLAPLLLLHKDESKSMRLSVSLGVAAATILIGLVPDSEAFVTATLFNLTDIGFRPDSQSLSGLLAFGGIDFFLSPVVWITVGLALVAMVGLRSATVSDLIGRAGLAMGLVFIIGQAFPNYWFLVLALIAIGSVVDDGERPRIKPLTDSAAQPAAPTSEAVETNP